MWKYCIQKVLTSNLQIPISIKMQLVKDRIKNIVNQPAEKFNVEHKLIKCNVGERVLLRVLNVGHSSDKTTKTSLGCLMGHIFYQKGLVKMFMVTNSSNNKVIGKFHASPLHKFYEK